MVAFLQHSETKEAIIRDLHFSILIVYLFHFHEDILNTPDRIFGPSQIVEVTIPELEEMRLAHFVTIGSECYTSLGVDYQKS